MRIAAIIVLAAFLAACSPKSPPPAAPVQTAAVPGESKEDLNEKAFAQIQAKNFPEAVRLAEQAVKLDPEFAPARFNLGLALYRLEQYQEAAPHLEAAYAKNKAQVEPGWFLMLSLEKLGEVKRAVAILTDLQARFPADKDVHGASERMLGVLWKVPGWISGNLAITKGADGKSLIAYDAAGTEKWRCTLAAPILFWEWAGENRVLVLTDAGAELVDLTRGSSLGKAPAQVAAPVNEKYGRRIYAGDWVYNISSRHSNGKYDGDVITIYRLKAGQGGLLWEQVGEPQYAYNTNVSTTIDGRSAFFASMSDDTLVVDGKPVRRLPEITGISPRGDVLYEIDLHQAKVLSLEGTVLWTTPLTSDYLTMRFWPRTDGVWFVGENPTHEITIYKRGADPIRAGTGEVAFLTSKYLAARRGEEVHVLDGSGKAVLVIPRLPMSLSADEQWVEVTQNGELRTFRLP